MIETGISEYWRLARELSVQQAVCLIIGIDPESAEGAYCDGWDSHLRPKGYGAVKAALTHAILSLELSATIRRQAWERGWNEEPSTGQAFTNDVIIATDDASFDAALVPSRGLIYHTYPDWMLTTVKVNDLKGWLVAQGFHTGFFFPDDSKPSNTPDYLNPKHPRYPHKLAAAIKVWEAMEDENLRKGKGNVDAMKTWLETRYSELGLVYRGERNDTGITEAAKVANWDDKGGAPTTPTKYPPTP